MALTAQAPGAARANAAAAAAPAVDLLEQAISATKQTEPQRAEQLLRTLTEQALEGTVTYSKNLSLTITEAIKQIDAKISTQLAAVMHHPKFQQLEEAGAVSTTSTMNTETSASLKLRVMNWSKRELHRDLTRATEFDQSQLFKKIYESEFGTPGGQPYGALIGDYEFTNHPEDVDTLRLVSNVAAAAFAPFIFGGKPQAPGPRLVQGTGGAARSPKRSSISLEYTKWNAYRDTGRNSRFVNLVLLPRVLGAAALRRADEQSRRIRLRGGAHRQRRRRAAHGARRILLDECLLRDGNASHGCVRPHRLVHDHPRRRKRRQGREPALLTSSSPAMTAMSTCNARPSLALRIGARPTCRSSASSRSAITRAPDYAVFFGAQTTQKAKKYDRPDATANAAISARLPYMMASSRIAHYLKVIARDKIGSFKEASDVEAWLKRWIENYTNSNPSPSEDAKARYPLREARISVEEIPGRPGSYNAVAHMRPWLQMEELTTSLRMVASIPAPRR